MFTSKLKIPFIFQAYHIEMKSELSKENDISVLMDSLDYMRQIYDMPIGGFCFWKC